MDLTQPGFFSRLTSDFQNLNFQIKQKKVFVSEKRTLEQGAAPFCPQLRQEAFIFVQEWLDTRTEMVVDRFLEMYARGGF